MTRESSSMGQSNGSDKQSAMRIMMYWIKKPFFLVPLFITFGVVVGATSVRLLGTYGGVWERQAIIASACKDHNFSGVFLGNSVSMNGVDTKIVSDRFSPGKNFYNFSSGGQGLLESLDIIDNLPSGCDVVAWGIVPFAFDEEHDVPQDVWTKYYFSGLTPSASLLNLAEKIQATSTSGYFDQLEVQRSLHSRWVYRSVIDNSLRQILRKDLDLEHSNRDLFYPSPYTRHLSDDKKNAGIKQKIKDLEKTPFTGKLSSDFVALVNYFNKSNESKHRRGVLVVMPLRPEILDAMGRDKVNVAIKELKEKFPHLPVLDLHECLDSSRFVDLMHPDREGATRISKKLAMFLEELYHTKSAQL